MRAIDARNAFIMNSLLQEVTRSGTAARAQATLKRPDLYGKTGTTNDSMDAWFAGFQPTLAAVTWIGYDTPRKLGDRETGGGLSLPVWISFMEHALKGVPGHGTRRAGGRRQRRAANGITTNTPGDGGVTSLGLDDADRLPAPTAGQPCRRADEKRRILDLFKN